MKGANETKKMARLMHLPNAAANKNMHDVWRFVLKVMVTRQTETLTLNGSYPRE